MVSYCGINLCFVPLLRTPGDFCLHCRKVEVYLTPRTLSFFIVKTHQLNNMGFPPDVKCFSGIPVSLEVLFSKSFPFYWSVTQIQKQLVHHHYHLCGLYTVNKGLYQCSWLPLLKYRWCMDWVVWKSKWHVLYALNNPSCHTLYVFVITVLHFCIKKRGLEDIPCMRRIEMFKI